MASMISPTTRDSNPRRKFSLVKCKRCRLDKKKCLPLEREWPARCDRCAERGYLCSTGTRIRRSPKRHGVKPGEASNNVQTATSHSSFYPVPVYISAEVSEDTLTIEEMVKDFSTLWSFHDLMSLALKRLHQLKHSSLRLFLDESHRGRQIYWAIKQAQGEKIMDFFHVLELKLSAMRPEVFANAKLQRLRPCSTSRLIYDTLSLLSWEDLRPLPFGSGEDDIIKELEGNGKSQAQAGTRSAQAHYDLGNLARAYLIRLSRIDRNIRNLYYWVEGTPVSLNTELSGLHALSEEANDCIRDVLSRHDLLTLLPDESQHNLLFRSDHINFEFIHLEKEAHRDCLGRTALHQALDAVPSLDPRYKQGRLLLNNFETYFSDKPADYVNQQDILGRTLLHLASEKGWEQGVHRLLEAGADPSLKTIYGSLALHYAVATEHIEIASMLLYSQRAATADMVMDRWGKTVWDYAHESNNPDLIELFLNGISIDR